MELNDGYLYVWHYSLEINEIVCSKYRGEINITKIKAMNVYASLKK